MPSDRGGFRDRRGNPDDTAEGMFQRLDLNGDGYLNFDEMPPQLRNERDQWDKDRNGLIDLNEFRAYYQARVQPPSTGQSATSGGGGTSFTGGSGFSGGGTSFSGGMSGGPGGMGVGPGNVSAYEHRLAEVEKKLQTLIDEVKALSRCTGTPPRECCGQTVSFLSCPKRNRPDSCQGSGLARPMSCAASTGTVRPDSDIRLAAVRRSTR